MKLWIVMDMSNKILAMKRCDVYIYFVYITNALKIKSRYIYYIYYIRNKLCVCVCVCVCNKNLIF